MTPNAFAYQRAGSVADAIARFKHDGEDARFLAGGHSLIPAMKLRLNSPSTLIDLSALDELKGIEKNGSEIHIGALTSHREVEFSDVIWKNCPVLAVTAGGIGDPQVRNRGTIGGSLAHADPAADYPAVVLALDAVIEVQGADGARHIAADDFFTGMFDTALDEGELITGVSFPVMRPHAGASYAKFANPASRYAIVGVAAYVEIDAGGACQATRIAITGAGPMVFRASDMEQALIGQSLNDTAIANACSKTPDPDELMSDLSGSAEYRAHLCGVMAKKALLEAAKAARKG